MGEPTNPAPEARIQDPIRIRRRGRPNNPRRELSQWETLLQMHARQEEATRAQQIAERERATWDLIDGLGEELPEVHELANLIGIGGNNQTNDQRGRRCGQNSRESGRGNGPRRTNSGARGGSRGGVHGGAQRGGRSNGPMCPRLSQLAPEDKIMSRSN